MQEREPLPHQVSADDVIQTTPQLLAWIDRARSVTHERLPEGCSCGWSGDWATHMLYDMVNDLRQVLSSCTVDSDYGAVSCADIERDLYHTISWLHSTRDLP